MPERVLVTGGAGYIGSHACKALAEAGFQPVTVDSLRTGHRWAVRWGPLEQLNVRDTADLERVVQAHAPIAVMHFAAYSLVGESVARPLAYHRNNVEGVLSVLAAMIRHDVRHLVFSSTAAVYGDPDTVPIPESHPLRLGNPYGASKLACERAIADLAATGAISAALLRYFNAAGADPDGAVGEAHEPETHLIPNAVRATLNSQQALTVNGDDYDTPDGTAIRDFVHVCDLAEAHVAALRYLLAGGMTTTLNLGTGTGASVLEVVRACERDLGRVPAYQIGLRRSGDPPRLVADATAARQVLGWSPRMSDLETIVKTAAAWEMREERRSGL